MRARLPHGFDWVEIPGGEVAIGRDPAAPGGPIEADELPQHVVELPVVRAALTPVTVAQYAAFVADGGAAPPADWPGGAPPAERADHPSTFVDWFDAHAFCAWAGGRLPTEAEWEKAARGDDARVFPWGDDADPIARSARSRPKHGDDVAGRRARRRREPLRSARHGRQRLGVGLERLPAVSVRPGRRPRGSGRQRRARPARRLLREPRPRARPLRQAQPQPPAPPPGAHRFPCRERRENMSEQVSADRLRDRTLALVEVESPTGDTAEVSRLYAAWARELGMEVEVLEDVFPATPTLVCRLKGGEPGPTVALCAHLDTVPIPHDPPRVEGDRIYGRGSADMKGAAVCALEAAQVLAASGPFAGELVLVLIGLHEAPGGRGEDLTHLLDEDRLHRRLRRRLRALWRTTSRWRTWGRRPSRSRSRGRACRRTSCRRPPARRIRCRPRRA